MYYYYTSLHEVNWRGRGGGGGEMIFRGYLRLLWCNRKGHRYILIILTIIGMYSKNRIIM